MAKKAPKQPEVKERKKKEDLLTPARKRFVELYLGSDGGKCWNSATMAYLWAFYGDNTPSKTSKGELTSEYKVSMNEGHKLLVKPCIIAYKNKLLSDLFKPEEIKNGMSEWAKQKKNPVVSLKAYETIAKITGVMKDDAKIVDLPQLVALTATIQAILTPKK